MMMKRIMPAAATLIVLTGCDRTGEVAQPDPAAGATADAPAIDPRRVATPAPDNATREAAPATAGTPAPAASESAPPSPSPRPSPAPSSEPTLYTLPNVPAGDVARNRATLTAIPASYLGQWDGVEGSCAPDSDLRMMVRPGSIGFYESRGEVTAVRRTRDGLVVSLAMEGEGERWEEDYSMRLVGGRERLAVTASSYPDRITMRKRCPADRGSSAP